MGYQYYLARDDNHTLYELGKHVSEWRDALGKLPGAIVPDRGPPRVRTSDAPALGAALREALEVGVAGLHSASYYDDGACVWCGEQAEGQAVKQERGRCFKCGKHTAVRDGEAPDGRPQYVCLNYPCGNSWTNGQDGEDWDTQPASINRVFSYAQHDAELTIEIAKHAAEFEESLEPLEPIIAHGAGPAAPRRRRSYLK